MQLLDNVIIIGLIVLAFLAGKYISDSYNSSIIETLEFQLRTEAAQKGVGFVPAPVKKVPIGQQFMDKLKENGRATTALRSPRT